MKLRFTQNIATAVVVLSFAGTAAAQSYSPSSTYANPETETANQARQRGPCSDPWVTLALERVYGRADQAKCNASLYNGGRWDSYNTLIHAVAKAKSSGGGSTASLPTIDLSKIKYQCSTQDNCTVFSNEGDKVGTLDNGNFRAEVPPKMVAAGGGNLIGMDGATLIGNDAGSMVAAGSLNLIARKVEMNPPASPMSGYSLQGVNDFRSLQKKSIRQTAGINPKYEQVSQVMKSVFSGGDLGPNSRAVKHAADTDMPARGGTPEALKTYLQQNATVKKWYQDNFQLK